jgi:hypothetical protein
MYICKKALFYLTGGEASASSFPSSSSPWMSKRAFEVREQPVPAKRAAPKMRPFLDHSVILALSAIFVWMVLFCDENTEHSGRTTPKKVSPSTVVPQSHRLSVSSKFQSYFLNKNSESYFISYGAHHES